MNKNQKQDTLQEMIEILKGDYNFPAKLWVWGKVVKEWAGIIIGTFIFLLIALFLTGAIIKGVKEGREESKLKNQSKSEDTTQNVFESSKVKAQRVLSQHMEEIATFMKASAESVNERQEIVEELAQEISSYAGRHLTQDEVEGKQTRFSSILSTCNHSRGRYMDKFARGINPFDDPHISDAFREVAVDNFSLNSDVLNPDKENKRWEDLCDFCRKEANKAKDELVQLLKSTQNN